MSKMLHSSNEDVFLEYEEMWKEMEDHSEILEYMIDWKNDKEFARKVNLSVFLILIKSA